MNEWKLITDEVPADDGTYICTIEATEGNRTWRFAAECEYSQVWGWFSLSDTTEYGEDCTLDKDEGWTGVWQPFSFINSSRRRIQCKLIAWVPLPEPYTGDGYSGETNEAYSYEWK